MGSTATRPSVTSVLSTTAYESAATEGDVVAPLAVYPAESPAGAACWASWVAAWCLTTVAAALIDCDRPLCARNYDTLSL